MDVDASRAMKSKNSRHEYNKYSREFSDESMQKQKQKAKKNSKRLQLDLDNVNEDELTSDELQVLEYRRKKLERQNKKTLGDVFQEKKQKNKQRKEKFEKHVLKHFKRGDESADEATKSSEEIITPLKRVKLSRNDPDECNSSEEKCPWTLR